MKKNNAFNRTAEIFKSLGHPVRILMLNLMKTKPRHGQELSEILTLNSATVSHHLTKLSDAGLITSEKKQYYQEYSLSKDNLNEKLSDMIFKPTNDLNSEVEVDAYKEKVLKTFLVRGRLNRIPAQLKKRVVILEELVKDFEPEKKYSEIEVNRILIEYHDDVATLRREMVGHNLMKRTRDGIYCKV